MIVIGVSSQSLKYVLAHSVPLYGAWEVDLSAVFDADAMPFIIPPYFNNAEQAKEILSRIDGLLLCGGGDIDGQIYGKSNSSLIKNVDRQRDDAETFLIQAAIEMQKPILAICRGIQMLNVALGGTLIEDIPTQIPDAITHRPIGVDLDNPSTHDIHLQSNSQLFSIFYKTETLSVNSFHHQAIQELGLGLKVNAQADDGVIEGIELEGHRYCIGVQWHPEIKSGNRESMLPLYQSFIVEAAKVY